jgi:hypothetical protein
MCEVVSSYQEGTIGAARIDESEAGARVYEVIVQNPKQFFVGLKIACQVTMKNIEQA